MTSKAGKPGNQNPPTSDETQIDSKQGALKWVKFRSLVGAKSKVGPPGVHSGFSKDSTETMIGYLGGYMGMEGFKNAVKSGKIAGLLNGEEGKTLYAVKSIDDWIEANLRPLHPDPNSPSKKPRNHAIDQSVVSVLGRRGNILLPDLVSEIGRLTGCSDTDITEVIRGLNVAGDIKISGGEKQMISLPDNARPPVR